MIVLEDERAYKGARSAVAMGMFDGMHIGHRALIAAVKNAARERGVPCVVYTYRNHPLSILKPEAAPEKLMSACDKLREMEKLGVDCVVARRFTRELADTDAETFLRGLCASLRPIVIAAGFNHSFGKGGAGNAEFLRGMAAELGYEALIVPPTLDNGAPVSSSRVRALLHSGKADDIETARRLLGRDTLDTLDTL